MALLRFRQTYRASGYEDSPTELPDHLCVVLEYAATIDPAAGRQLLLDHRAGLEVLRLALSEAGSPWAGAVEAVCATLPAAAGRRDRGDPAARRRGPAGGGGRPGAVRLDRADPAADACRCPCAGAQLMDVFLWVIVPYLCLATFVVGHFWRYRYDKFGWTTRSSQLYEDRLLRIGSPAVPLRDARRRRRPRHRAAGPGVLDRRARDQHRGPTTSSRSAAACSRA